MFKINKLFFLVLGIILVAIYFSLPPLGLYCNDGGAKYMQMRAFASNGWKSIEIDYPAKNIDPELKHTGEQRILLTKDGKFLCSYNPAFTFISSLFYPLLGDRVIHLIPLLALFLSVLILGKTLKMVMKENYFYYILLAAYAFVSPVFLYSLTFWEHLPLLLLIMTGLFFITKYFKESQSNKDLFFSFFFICLGFFFRPEITLFVAATALPLIVFLLAEKKMKDVFSIVLGSATSIILYIIVNLIIYKNALGLHGVNIRGFSFFPKFPTLIFVVFFIAILYLILKRKDQEEAANLWTILPLIWVGFLLMFLNKSPVNTLLVQFPLCLMLFYNIKGSFDENGKIKISLENLIILSFVIFLSLTALFAYTNPHRSVRYLLPVIPSVFIFLGIKSESILKNKSVYGLIILLIILSAGSNAQKLKYSILKYKYFNQGRYEFLKENTKDGDVIIFSGSRLMEHAGPLHFDRKFMAAQTADELIEILEKVKMNKTDICYYNTHHTNGAENWFKSKKRYKILEKYPFKRGLTLFKIRIR